MGRPKNDIVDKAPMPPLRLCRGEPPPATLLDGDEARIAALLKPLGRNGLSSAHERLELRKKK